VTLPANLIARLNRFCWSRGHVFWPDGLSITDERLFKPAFVRGHRQVTDVYLLGLAVKRGGRLATFDRTIPLGAVAGATPGAIAVISDTA
jgi:hypothetical protein